MGPADLRWRWASFKEQWEADKGLGKFRAKSYLLSRSTAWPLNGDGQEGALLDV